MKKRIINAFNIAKRIVYAMVATDDGFTGFRSRIVTIENEDEEPFAEVLAVFEGTTAVKIQVQYNGTTYSKDLEDEEQIINEIEMAVSQFEKLGITNLVWLGE